MAPIAALRTLAPFLKQCHIKDAIRATTVGNWGLEVAVGTGQIDWPTFFTTLDELGYGVYFSIEREAGEQRVVDVKAASQTLVNHAINHGLGMANLMKSRYAHWTHI